MKKGRSKKLDYLKGNYMYVTLEKKSDSGFVTANIILCPGQYLVIPFKEYDRKNMIEGIRKFLNDELDRLEVY